MQTIYVEMIWVGTFGLPSSLPETEELHTHVLEILNIDVNENNFKKSTFFRRIFFQAVKN